MASLVSRRSSCASLGRGPTCWPRQRHRLLDRRRVRRLPGRLLGRELHGGVRGAERGAVRRPRHVRRRRAGHRGPASMTVRCVGMLPIQFFFSQISLNFSYEANRNVWVGSTDIKKIFALFVCCSCSHCFWCCHFLLHPSAPPPRGICHPREVATAPPPNWFDNI